MQQQGNSKKHRLGGTFVVDQTMGCSQSTDTANDSAVLPPPPEQQRQQQQQFDNTTGTNNDGGGGGGGMMQNDAKKLKQSVSVHFTPLG